MKLLKSLDFQTVVILRHYKRSEAIQKRLNIWIASLRSQGRAEPQ
jgi:hypothetical protein